MSVKIPSSFEFGIGLDLEGGIDLDVTIPTSYSVGISSLPLIDVNLRPIEIKPMDISFRIKEIPSVRAHLPLDYKVGFTILGRELACIRLCGQGQVITEPYVPYPCEPRASIRQVDVTSAQETVAVPA